MIEYAEIGDASESALACIYKNVELQRTKTIRIVSSKIAPWNPKFLQLGKVFDPPNPVLLYFCGDSVVPSYLSSPQILYNHLTVDEEVLNQSERVEHAHNEPQDTALRDDLAGT